MAFKSNRNIEFYANRISYTPLQNVARFTLGLIGLIITSPITLSKGACLLYRKISDKYGKNCESIRFEYKNNAEFIKKHEERIFEQTRNINPMTGLPRYLN